MAEREAAFEAAEDVRLLYIAVTRAKRELVVARYEYVKSDGSLSDDKCRWAPLTTAMDQLAARLDMPHVDAPAAPVAGVTIEAIDACTREIAQRHKAAIAAGWAHRTVTQETKRQLELPEPDEELRTHVGRGREWGSAVHRVIEGRLRGRTGDALRDFAQAVAAEEAVDDINGLLAIVARLEAQGHFAHGIERMAEASVVRIEERDGGTVLVEGVIDAARLVDGAWLVLDWKTDLTVRDDASALRAQYQGQVDAYACMLSSLLKMKATGTLIGVGDVTPPA